MSDKYILEEKKPVKCHDLMKWAAWYETANRCVGDDTVNKVRVSTVFLGLDHRFGDVGEPLIFETMTFGAKDDECERCSTWEQAEAQHAAMVEKYK